MKLLRTIFICLAVLLCVTDADANNDTWKAAVSGIWGTGANWTDGTTPGIADSATFDKPGTYTVTLNTGTSPIQALSVTNANVTLATSGGFQALHVSSGGGSTSATVVGGSSLTLGTTGNPIQLSDIADLRVGSGINTGQLNVSNGSILSTSLLHLGQNGNGTLVVDGLNSNFNAGLSGDVGLNGYTGQLDIRNSATGHFGPIDLADSSTPGSAAVFSVESDADVTASGGITLAYNSVGTATLNIQGTGSTLTQSPLDSFNSPNYLNVGTPSTGSATINIGVAADGGTLTTGIGGLTVYDTATITVGSGANTGTLVSNGGLNLNGGRLTVGPGSTFNVNGLNGSVNINNGGQLVVDAAATFSYDATMTIAGGGSANIGTIISANYLDVRDGGSLSAGGLGSSGTMAVDGASSSFAAGSFLLGGGSSTIFSNGAAATISDSFTMFAETFADASLMIESGTQFNTGTLQIVSYRTFSNSTVHTATATVTGTGSTLSIFPGSSLSVGGTVDFYDNGPVAINVLDDASLTVGVGGTTILNTSGKINIDGGIVDLATLDNQGGKINFTAGSLRFLGNLTVGTNGSLGNNLTLHGDQQLTLSGTTTVDTSRSLTLDGGTLETGDLDINGTFNFIAGTLSIDQNGASIDYPIVTNATTTINLNANNVSLGDPTSVAGFQHQGVLLVGANTVTLQSAGYARLGIGTVLFGGTINAPNGVYLSGGANLLGYGTVNARVIGDGGSVIEAAGPLALGDAASVAGFNYAGELRTKQFTVTLNSSARAGLGNLTTLGSGATPGTLIATNGFVVDFDESITGFGTIVSSNTLAKQAIVNGIVQGNSAAQRITLTGYIKGIGTFNNVNFTGTFSPGLSPTVATVSNISLAPTSTLIMELGGTTTGSGYDQIQSSGTLFFDGTLRVSLINGFTPTAGQSFNLFDWSSQSGTFDTLDLPALAGLAWNTSQLYTSGALSLAAAVGLTGDYNSNGSVDAADYVLWRKNPGGFPANAYDTWRSHFGQPAGSGAGASANAAVPEPTTLVLLIFAAAGWCLRRGRAP